MRKLFQITIIMVTWYMCTYPKPIKELDLPWIRGQEPTLTAYDCAETTDMRNIQYHKEKTCINEDELYTHQRNISAIVIQDTEHEDIPAYECKFRRSNSYFHCGMFSHMTPVNYLNTALEETKLPANECRRAKELGYLRLNGEDHVVQKEGLSTLHLETRGGTWLSGGSVTCWGESFLTNSGHRFGSGVEYVMISLEITKITLQLHKGKLHIKNRRQAVPCRKAEEFCETRKSTIYWNYNDKQCSAAMINKFKGLELVDQKQQRVIHSTDGNFIRLIIHDEKELCGHQVYATNLENIYLIYANHENATAWANTQFTFDPISVQTYIADRDDYILSQLHKEITDVYAQVSNHRCIADHILKARYPLLMRAPAQAAKTWQIEDNLFAKHAGKSFYTFRCQKVNVIPRAATVCYNRLPVYYKTEETSRFFLDPDTHILHKKASIIPCPEVMFDKYQDNSGRWIAADKTPFHTMAPNSFTVRSPVFQVDHLVVGGLVSRDKIKDAEERWAFDNSETELLNHFTHTVINKESPEDIVTSNIAKETEKKVEQFSTTLFSPMGNWFRKWQMTLIITFAIIMGLVITATVCKFISCITDPVKCCINAMIYCTKTTKQIETEENERNDFEMDISSQVEEQEPGPSGKMPTPAARSSIRRLKWPEETKTQ